MINSWLLTSNTDNRATPQHIFDYLNEQFNFTLDPCADDVNHKCSRYFTKEQDWLQQDWSNERVFMNPPYGREIGKRVKKARDTVLNSKAMVLCLLPARTDTKRFHDYIYNNEYNIGELHIDYEFVKWRLKFWWSKNPAPFPSMLVLFTKFWHFHEASND